MVIVMVMVIVMCDVPMLACVRACV
jgi:hypothetical protein